MAQGYLAQVQALIAQKMKENPEEMKRKLKEIEEAKKKAKEVPKSPPKPSIDPQLTKELIEELDKRINLDIHKVKDLIKRGADIKAKGEYEITVLHWACQFGDIELAKECLQAGIDVNIKDYDGRSPLHYARSVTIAKYLISAGADVNAKNEDGESPLRMAALRNNIETAKLLIDSGADVNAKDYLDRTPLHGAKSKEMRVLLIEHGATKI